MKKIIRKLLQKDLQGEILSSKTEEMCDDETGTVVESHVTSVIRCTACRRPLTKIEDIRGVCERCGRSCCNTCLGECAVCKRPLCGLCRRGFADKGLSVCTDCLPLLQQRMQYQDHLQEGKTAFERMHALCNTQLKFIQLLQQDGGSLTDILSQFAQIRLERKLKRLEKQAKQEKNRGR